MVVSSSRQWWQIHKGWLFSAIRLEELFDDVHIYLDKIKTKILKITRGEMRNERHSVKSVLTVEEKFQLFTGSSATAKVSTTPISSNTIGQ